MITQGVVHRLNIAICFALAYSVAAAIPRTNCALSNAESRGFFCEDDESWKRRRHIFASQEKRQVTTQFDNVPEMRAAWWQGNYEPNFSCTHEERIGRKGDGGKWICDPESILRTTANQHKKCLVYSIGSNNDFSFEEAILERLPSCEIHTFDHTILPKGVPKGVNFHPIGLAAKDSRRLRTLGSIAKRLRHDTGKYSLEILKIDIEGSEWDTVIPQLENLDKTSMPLARQIQIELHPRNTTEVRRFFDLLKANGYVITHKEPNIFQGGRIVEYALLNLGWDVNKVVGKGS